MLLHVSMLKAAILTTLLVLVAHAKRLGYDRRMKDAVTYDCCWPRHLSATLLTTAGYPEHVPEILDVYREFHYDGDNDRWAVIIKVEYFTGEVVESMWMEDYRRGRLVQKQGLGQKKCGWRPLDYTGLISRCCVADRGAYVERARHGAHRTSMAYDVHEWTAASPALGGADVTVMTRTQVATCLPVMETAWWAGANDTTHVANVEFVNIDKSRDLSFMDDVYSKYDCDHEITDKTRFWQPEPWMVYLRARLAVTDPEKPSVEPTAKPVHFKKDFDDDF